MSLLLSRWLLTLLGTAALAGLVWVFGPLWPPLEPALPRLLVIQTLLVLWAVANAALDWRRRARAAALDSGLAASASGEEGAAVRDTLTKALALLRKSGGRGALTELPWYAIIGPPGAGKTTALLNAGLRFTLAEQMGRAAVAGVGGTRLCEWWFTEDAVLIDTAGRYTTQDSDAAVDRAGWNAFLSLLKRTRPQQPLNGVIVAIGLPDVLGADPAERDAHAAAIARRITELEGRFGLRMPVYALFTKADLVAGFTEFFDDLDAEARNQVWGETFAFGRPAPLGDRFLTGFRALSARVATRMLPRLAAEHRVERRGAIAGFPTQFASLEKPLNSFLGTAFAGSTLLRGVYFASGTQEGTPIDRLTGAMSRAFGIAPGRQAALRPEAGRSYFLGRLLREVIFGEAMLVREPPGRARRRTLGRAAGFTLVALLLAGTAAALLWSARTGEDQVARLSAPLGAYSQAAGPLATDPVADGDLRPLVAQLDAGRALADAVPTEPVPFGFGQGAKLEAGARTLYRNGLAYGLLPRLLWRLEAEMRGELDRPDALYATTRVYLMLGGAGPLDPAPVRDYLARDWTRAFPDDPELVTGLLTHLDRLLAEPLPAVALDGPLVAAARASMEQVPLANRVYAGIGSSAAATALPVWRPLDSLGLAGVTVFARASGKPMTEGIPGLFTANGYRTVLLGELPAATRRVAAESWVTGRTTAFSAAELQALQQAVTTLYGADFNRRWDAMLADLSLAPVTTLPQAAQALYIIASAESPLRALLRSIGQQVALPGPAGGRYAPLVALTAGDGAALERSLRLVADIQQQLAKIAALPVGTAAPGGGDDIGNAVAADAVRQPAPLDRWLGTIAATAQALRTGNARRRIALAYAAPGGPAASCAAAVAQYPFNPGGPPLPPEEFARVFGPGGALDGFLNTQLKPYIDMTAKPWKPQPAGTAPAPLGAADVAQLQRAATIRDAWFPAGQVLPGLSLDITPTTARAATLTLGGTAIASGKGPARATQLSWPPPSGSTEASLVAEPGPTLRETGPWALNRLFARGRLTPGPKPGHQTLSFDAPPGTLSYDIALPGTANPVAPGLFTEFRCPAVQ